MPYARLHDVELHYSLEGEAGLPVLILSNSLGTSLDMWLPQLPALSASFRVLRYDTRGHGLSGVTPGPYSIAQLGADVIALMDHLAIARAHFCGVSMGGITGMWLGIHHADRLHKLVLSNTAAYIGPPDNWTTRANAVTERGVAHLAPAVVARWLTPDYASAHPEQVAVLETMLSATPAAGYAAGCVAVRDNDLRQQVQHITVPTLVIAGTHDLPTPPADGQFLRRTIPGAAYVELAGAHLTNQQHVAAYSAAVLDFLA
jgi:3-oxoadipate enol-lactonase